jgi:ABC-type multidrug transport system ATPase subunit
VGEYSGHKHTDPTHHSPDMSRLHVDSVRKEIGDRCILNDVFMCCSAGEVIGILGINGAGKSSLLKIVFGSLAANQSFVTVDDRRTGGLYSSKKLIQYLPQHKFLPAHLKIDVLISCFCGRRNAALLREQDWIRPFLSKKPSSLSTGERRMVEIGILLFSEAKFVLLDEPFNGIAPIHLENMKILIRQNAFGKGIIITGQDYRNVIELSSRIILMQDGNTREIKDPRELIEYGYLPQTADLNWSLNEHVI